MADSEPLILSAPGGPERAARRRGGRKPARPSEIRDLRLARGWTIAQAVEWLATLGTHRHPARGTWKKWESGENPSPAIVLRLLRGEQQLVEKK